MLGMVAVSVKPVSMWAAMRIRMYQLMIAWSIFSIPFSNTNTHSANLNMLLSFTICKGALCYIAKYVNTKITENDRDYDDWKGSWVKHNWVYHVRSVPVPSRCSYVCRRVDTRRAPAGWSGPCIAMFWAWWLSQRFRHTSRRSFCCWGRGIVKRHQLHECRVLEEWIRMNRWKLQV